MDKKIFYNIFLVIALCVAIYCSGDVKAAEVIANDSSLVVTDQSVLVTQDQTQIQIQPQPQPQSDQQGNIYEVKNLKIEAEDSTAILARSKAIINGKREALLEICAIHNCMLEARIESEEDEFITGLMKDFSLRHEQFSKNGYRALMSVNFQPEKIQSYFGAAHLTLTEQDLQPVLIIPVLSQSGQFKLWEEDNFWAKAWAKYKKARRDMVLPLGDSKDMSLASIDKIMAGDFEPIYALQNHYGARAVLMIKLDISATDDGRLQWAYEIYDYPFGQMTLAQQETLDEISSEEQALADIVIKTQRAIGTLIQKSRDNKDNFENNLQTEATPSVLSNAQPNQFKAVFKSFQEWVELQKRLRLLSDVENVNILSLGSESADIALTLKAPTISLSGQIFADAGVVYNMTAQGVAELSLMAGFDPIHSNNGVSRP